MLVVRLGVIEAFERRDLGDDFSGEDVGGIELGDVGLCDAALLVAGIEDRRAVGGADVGALAVELSGIVGDGEEDAEELAVGDLRGIVDDLDGFGVAGGFGADLVVGGGGGRAAGVANRGGEYAFYTLEDRLRAPETAAASTVAAGMGVLVAARQPAARVAARVRVRRALRRMGMEAPGPCGWWPAYVGCLRQRTGYKLQVTDGGLRMTSCRLRFAPMLVQVCGRC
jgi:hypothetical protein